MNATGSSVETDLTPGAAPPPDNRAFATGEPCTNCGSSLQGAFCHRCGQPTRHFIRFFPVVVRELTEDTLGVDGRFWRTFVALLFRPGRLTLDYLNGKRVYYSPPIRLYLLTSLIAFLVITTVVDSALDASRDRIIFDTDTGQVVPATPEMPELPPLPDLSGLSEEQAAKVRRSYEQTQAAIAEHQRERQEEREERAQAAAADPSTADPSTADTVEDDSSTDAEPDAPDGNTRTAETSATDEPTTGERTQDAADADAADDDENSGSSFVLFGSEEWDMESNPVTLPFLTQGMNDRLNREIGEFEERIPEIKDNPRILVDEILEVLPQTMFLLLPAFALILKFYYLFARRYYMEHLLFSLHNHAFVFAMITLMAVVDWLGEWSAGGESSTWWSENLILAGQIWLYVYLFLAQKRVYQQGWIMTFIKYGLVGFSYSIVLILALVFASLVGILLV